MMCSPDLFVLGENGKVMLLTESVPKDLESAVEDAEACCPTEAISVLR
jgi:ferredoxin